MHTTSLLAIDWVAIGAASGPGRGRDSCDLGREREPGHGSRREERSGHLQPRRRRWPLHSGVTPVVDGVKLPAQVDVLRKAPDGSVRHALVSFVLPAFPRTAKCPSIG